MKTKLNHVAMSVPADELDDAARKEIVDFYHDVFGWIDTHAEEEAGDPLIMRLSEWTQFVYVYPERGTAMKAPRLDHYGVEVDSEAELDEVLEKARRYREKDPRVEIVEKKSKQYGTSAEARANGVAAIELINCYVRFVLPLMVEVQCFKVVPS